MNTASALLRYGLLAGAGLLQACVTSPYYAPAPVGRVYYVQDPWFYHNGLHDCYYVWYGCPRPIYGYGYGHYRRPAPPPARPKPPHEEPVYAPKPPRLIRLGSGGSSAPGQVIRPPPTAAPAPPSEPQPVRAPAPQPPTNKPAPPRQPQQGEMHLSEQQPSSAEARQERRLRARVLHER